MRTPNLIAAALLAASLPTAARAASITDQLKLSDVIQTMKVNSDLRLRQENFDRKSARAVYRNRFRYRLRVGAEFQLPDDLLLNLRLGSGTGEQVSTNQSLDNLSSQKELWVDLISVNWKPRVSENGTVALTAGRMSNPLWRVYSSDLVWDDDFNPEGFAESADWLLLDGKLSLFANALQMIADEDSGTGRNQWLFTQQAGLEVPLPFKTRIRTAAAYHKWSDEQRSSHSPGVVNFGNRRVGGIIQNRFGTAEWTTQVSGWAGKVPVALQATLARNMRALGDPNVANGIDELPARDGYQFGTIIGRAKAEGSWEVAAFKKYSQADVTVADVADSDFGEGGTNRVGGIFWAAWNPREWMQVKAKYFTTKVLDVAMTNAAGDTAINRLQLDWSVKF